MEHTKGPWRYAGIHLISDSGEHHIADVTPYKRENKEANLKLICASPSLLEACQMLIIAISKGEITVYPSSDKTTDYIQIVENAIKKATE